MMGRFCAVLTTAALVLGMSPAFAKESNGPARGQFYIAPGAVAFEGPTSSRYGYDDIEIGPGLILGYGISDHWAVEVLASRIESDFENAFGSGQDDVDLAWLDFMYKFDGGEHWQPFLVFGGGRAKYRFDDVREDAQDNQFNAGIGVFREITEHIVIRADVRGVSTDKEGGVRPFAFLGLTGFIGAFPEPPPPPDSDGDGVPNDADQCPTTPPGRVVDATGCQLDTDGDSVIDAEDQCPDTPAGAAVDARGCPLDSDGDGVPDFRDDCPDSEAGAKVDERGCYRVLEEQVTIDMNIEFATNEATISPDHVPELSRVVKILREYPNADAVIEGHTDSDGAASYNQSLSERRAKAVYDYLISDAKVNASRLRWAGFGESRPVASNDTSAGKQRNRRVTAIVTGSQTVRQ